MAITKNGFEAFFGAEASQMMMRGRNFIDSQKVLSFTYDKASNHLGGEVERSMRKSSHKLWVQLSTNGKMESAFCPCARGAVRCAHIAAILILAREKVSSTDISCKWSKRKTPQDNAIIFMDSIYQRKNKKPKFEPDYAPVSCEMLEDFKQVLSACPDNSAAGVKFLLKPNPIPSSGDAEPDETLDYEPPNAISIIRDQEFDSEDPKSYIFERLILSRAEVIRVASLTTGQAQTPLWARVRCGRLTGSKFGEIIKAMKKKKGSAPSRSLMESLVFHKNLDGVKSITWGRTHKKTALKTFSEIECIQVEPTGIWLDERGIIGASPDGLIGEDGVIEIKCPYSLRTIDPKLALCEKKNFKKWCLHCEKGVWKIDKEHSFYHQIQGSLYFTRREYAFLVIWTPINLVYVKIDKDLEWGENLELLKKFYFEFFIPFVRSADL